MNELNLLFVSAASLGFAHTILGPDHYLPFIVLSKARQWSSSKTMWITFISGVGHVGGSVIIGMIGIAMGISLNKLEYLESFRGEIVGWMLFIFGLAYTIYGIYKYMKSSHHFHLPNFLLPKKIRGLQHLPTEDQKEDNTKLTPWILFLIFVFGPCEVLIPMLIFPAYENSTYGMFTVALIFGVVTISTMMLIVYIGHRGTSLIRLKKHEKYLHLVAGFLILLSALGILFLGW
ncbi:MAG: sulfite exporter TauE/SafE family protein [Draconibacterium sp.]|nr:sulfite exporter TauE/SafE family protein [Draconibacterium sp.]